MQLVTLRNAPLTQSSVYWRKFVVLSAGAWLPSGLVKNCDESAKKKRPRRLARKWKQDRDAAKTQLPSREVRGELNEYKRERSRGLRKQRKCMAVLRNDHTSRSLNSFNELFAIPFSILSLHMDDRLKVCAMPTNTNIHVSVQSKFIEICTYVCWMGAHKAYNYTLRTCTPSK